MVGKTKSPTKAQQRRMNLLPQVGCICCKQYGIYNDFVQIHHIVEGNKRLGHDATLPLCVWHHEGTPPGDWTREQTERKIGPSLKSKKRFNERFGGELELLEQVNELLQGVEDTFI